MRRESQFRGADAGWAAWAILLLLAWSIPTARAHGFQDNVSNESEEANDAPSLIEATQDEEESDDEEEDEGSLLGDDESDPPLVDDSSVGYIDQAIPTTLFRFRFDSAYHNTRPNRAEFFWPGGQPLGPGPRLAERAVDYQDFSFYTERAFGNRSSIFGNLPFRLLDPVRNDNTGGLADSDVGFKHALISSNDTVATLQFRTYIPSGDAHRGLGNRHVSLEPALLVFHRVSRRLTFESEIRDWIPVGGTESFAGNTIRYGLGAGWLFHETRDWKFRGIAEFVGWTVLDGRETVVLGDDRVLTRNAHGDTIVNAKLGLRVGLGQFSSFYAGYGRALTHASWYDNTFRLEFRRNF